MREDIIEKAIKEFHQTSAPLKDIASKYDLSREELSILKTAATLNKTKPTKISEHAKKEILSAIRGQFSPPIHARSKKLRTVALVTALLFLLIGGSLAFASTNAPPDSPLYPVRNSIEKIANFVTTNPELKARKLLNQANKHAVQALKNGKNKREKYRKAYPIIKDRLNKYSNVRSKIKNKNRLLNKEKETYQKYLEIKSEVAPKERPINITVTTETELEIQHNKPGDKSNERSDEVLESPPGEKQNIQEEPVEREKEIEIPDIKNEGKESQPDSTNSK